MNLYEKIPFLDLHGEVKDMVYPLLTSFLNEFILKRERVVKVIHGKGDFILRDELHFLLKNSKYVSNFHLNNNNLGETIIYLNLLHNNIDKKRQN